MAKVTLTVEVEQHERTCPACGCRGLVPVQLVDGLHVVHGNPNPWSHASGDDRPTGWKQVHADGITPRVLCAECFAVVAVILVKFTD